MKTKIRLTLLLLSSVFALQLQAQEKVAYGQKANAIIKGSQQIAYSDHTNAPVFISFSETSNTLEKEGFESLTKTLDIGINEELKLIKTENDDIGFIHKKYDQYYNNIKVEGGEYRIHLKDGKIRSMGGYWFDHINVNTTPTLSESEALDFALNYMNAEKYMWELESEENHLKLEQENPNATYFPKGELIIASRNLNYEKRDIHFCYKFDIYSASPSSRKIIYVDAQTGEVIAEQNRMCSADVAATATTLYQGVKPITTDQTGPSAYRLRESGRGNGIETYDMNQSTFFSTAVDFTNNSTVWNVPADNAAHDAHFGAEASYDYYLNIHNRNSFDDNGYKIKQYIHFGVNYNNANWDGYRMRFGDGSNLPGEMKACVAIDFCGHELTHGVMDFTCYLITQGESGALNESYADIMGTNIEFWKTPATAEWTFGDDAMVTPGTYIRNLQNPNATSFPDTYKKQFWHTSPADQNGVHKNSTVNSFWYYLLSMGGAGTNDYGNAYNVTGITRVKAEKIVYRAMAYYLIGYSQYYDARLYTIQAASDIYGACSPEVIETTKAWYAVGVGPNYNGILDANFTASGQQSCVLPFSTSFTNNSINGGNVIWDFGDGNTSTDWNPTHTYQNPGNYNVKLKITGACGTDSLVKNNFIMINTPTSPTVTNGARCGNGTVNLSANGTGTLNWYNNSTGGNSIHTGTSYTTPVLASTTSYYVENEVAGNNYSVGPVNQTFGSNGPFGNLTPAFMIFDIYEASILKTVDVVATNNGVREIQLLNPDGSLDTNYFFNLTAGNHTLTLNRKLEPGVGYHLGGDTLYMTVTGSNVNYPYVNPGLAAITGSSVEIDTLNLHVFHFFYNWQFETLPCKSVRTQVTATINTIPTATITPSGPTTFCTGESVTLTANAASSYLWNNGATTQSIVVNSSGNYSVTITNANGCSDPSNTTTVTVNALPTATITPSGPTTFCAGGSVTLTANPASSYLWSNGATTQSIIVNSSGNYSVTITNANGCSDPSNTTTVTVNALPTVNISANGPTSFCTGGSVDLTSNQTSGNVWSNSAVTQSINVTSSGNYSVIYTDGNGCSNSSNIINVSVSNSPLPTISASGSTTFCQGQGVFLTASNSDSYQWNLNGTPIIGQTNQTLSVNQAGNYTVTVTNTDACNGAGTSSITNVIVNSIPIATITPDNSTTFCNGNSVNLSANNANSYLWSNGATTQMINVATGGIYSVIVTDANGCNGTSNIINVTVNMPQDGLSIALFDDSLVSPYSSPSIWYNAGNPVSLDTADYFICTGAGNYFTTGTDLNGCIATSDTLITNCTLGIRAITQEIYINAFPNPFINEINLKFVGLENKNVQMNLINIIGELIASEKIFITQHQFYKSLDLSNLSNGTYFIQIQYDEQQETLKVTKNN